MNTYTLIAVIVCLIAATIVMGLGIFSMAKGGEFNKKYGNKIMQARVMIQGLAIAILALAYFASQG
jgi:uncharacterized membrane protein